MMVPIDITMREIPNSEAVEAKVRQKVAKLAQYYDRLEFCKVVIDLSQKRHHQGKLFTTHIEVGVPGKRLVTTHKHDEDLYVVIRDAFAAMNKQVKRYADRIHGDIKMHTEFLSGRIVRKFEDYGFIEEISSGDEYYFHASNLTGPIFGELAIGTVVTFLDSGIGDTLQASQVTRKEEQITHH